MAHILVYLQRTPVGLHPASALALCRARDIASERGATLTGLCIGDAGPLDKAVALAAGRFGADILVFGGPKGLDLLHEQLRPVHVLVPWTRSGVAVAETMASGPAVRRWLTTPQPSWGGADAVTAVVAGILPWHAFAEPLEAEYQADVDAVSMPSWVSELSARTSDDDAKSFSVGGDGPVRWLAPQDSDRETAAVLERLGATPADPDDPTKDAGTLLWLSTDPLPEALVERPVSTRLIVVPGTKAALDPSWIAAEWVLSGSRASALQTVHDSPWAPLGR